jgi:septum site-determining protein MinD
VPTIVAIHSFRGGTGKSNITANIAALLAARGQRVGVIDTDIQSPGLHILFGLDEDQVRYALNDYLWGTCSIAETAHDVTPALDLDDAGKIFLIPSSLRAGEIARVLREGFDVALLTAGFNKLIQELQLGVLLIDTHPGLNEETLLSIALSNVLVIIMRPDQQDYQGTSVAVEVARHLGVPHMVLVVNNVPAAFDAGTIRERAEEIYGCEVAAVLPHSEELMVLASRGIFALRYTDHPMTAVLQQLATTVSAGDS